MGSSTNRTQGTAALSVRALGYTVLTSRLLGPLGQVTPSISFDLGLPSPLAAGWAGATQLFVSIPSLNVNNAYIGQVELTGLRAGQYNRVSFGVPQSLLPALRGNYSDLTFSIVLNVPSSTSNTYLLDNLMVSSTIPPNTTVGMQDRSLILGFETQSPAWTITSGSVVGLNDEHDQGNFSLGFKPQSYSVLTSPPLPSIGPVASALSFDLELPTPTPAFASAQLYASIPSQGVNNAYVGQVDLTTLAPQLSSFRRATFTVPTSLVSKLNAQYTDLRFSIAFNVPSTNTAAFYVDNFQVGQLTTAPAPLPPELGPGDLVGTATSGLASFTYDSLSKSVNVTNAMFRVEQGDTTCVPSSTSLCRYVVHTASISTGPVPGSTITNANLVNAFPFEVVMGGNGSASLSSALPANVPFLLSTNIDGIASKLYPGANASISISPAGNGMIALSTQFSGSVDGHSITVNGAVTANAPLANRPPVAAAGADQAVTSSSCLATATLSGSSSDPDNNVIAVRWFDSSGLAGTGYNPTVKLPYTGSHVFTLEVEDSYGARSTDEVVVNTTLGATCSATPPAPPVIK